MVEGNVPEDTGTDSAIQLEVFAGENLVLREEIDDTSQSDLEKGTSNWYVMDAPVPFTRGEVQAGGRIVLSILGDDAWKPMGCSSSGWTPPAGGRTRSCAWSRDRSGGPGG